MLMTENIKQSLPPNTHDIAIIYFPGFSSQQSDSSRKMNSSIGFSVLQQTSNDPYCFVEFFEHRESLLVGKIAVFGGTGSKGFRSVSERWGVR